MSCNRGDVILKIECYDWHWVLHRWLPSLPAKALIWFVKISLVFENTKACMSKGISFLSVFNQQKCNNKCEHRLVLLTLFIVLQVASTNLLISPIFLLTTEDDFCGAAPTDYFYLILLILTLLIVQVSSGLLLQTCCVYLTFHLVVSHHS